MGTALNSIFPLVPSSIGAWSGFQAYEPYYTSEEPHYFDTKSPYTKMYIVWGGNGRAMTRVEFSRNINPRWNFGFDYRPILIEKQIQRRQKGDYQTTSHYYDFYTTYRSKDERYQLLFNYRRMRHRVKENGGVFNPTDSIDNLFKDNTRSNMTAAESEDYRRNIHLSQQYQIAKFLQVYHIVDLTRQMNIFRDQPAVDRDTLFAKTFNKYYDRARTDTVNLSDQTVLNTTQQEIGIKGNAAKFFYSAYYKFRTYDYSNVLLSPSEFKFNPNGSESYLGGTISLKFDSVSAFRGSAESLFLEGFYKIEGEVQSPWIEASFKNSLSKPGFMQQAYRGVHDSWNQKLNGVNATEAKGFLKWKGKAFQIWAGGTFTLFNNYIYFKDTTTVTKSKALFPSVTPVQSSGTQSTVSPEIKASFQFLKHLFIRPQFIYTRLLVNDDRVLRIPEQFINIQLAYENSLFKDHLQLQAGIDFHSHSAYRALAYSPTIQQFYIQDKTMSPQFPLVDIFFTGKMRRARFFLKYHNLVQMFTLTGYVPTPKYPGQFSVLDFGFEFLLFD